MIEMHRKVTVEAKQYFERIAQSHSANVKHYYYEDGSFESSPPIPAPIFRSRSGRAVNAPLGL